MRTPPSIRVALQDLTDDEALYIASRLQAAIDKLDLSSIGRPAVMSLLLNGVSSSNPTGLLNA